MNKIENIALIILTKNEEECLKVMLPKLPKPSETGGFQSIYAIDGGSTDGTVSLFEANNIPVLSQSKKGRGEAFLLAANNIQADAYLFFSPDGNEDPNDLGKFKSYLEQGADIVIASRMMKDAHNEEDHLVFKWRKWANIFFNLLANLFFRRSGSYISDAINGYRAITKHSFDILKLDAYDYTIEYQITIRALKNRLKIVEFPTYEGQRIAGDTGAPSIKTGLLFIKCFIRELFR